MEKVQLFLFALSVLGLVLLAAQLALVTLHRRRRPPAALGALPAISILKPLCGRDDALEANLASFARLDYPRFEVVLGVKDLSDAALGPALEAVARWPGVFRLEVQRGEPGLNPKVNQLITLSDRSRHDLLVISDSNVRVGRRYLREIAAHFSDPRVGCVSHPIVGVGERREWSS